MNRPFQSPAASHGHGQPAKRSHDLSPSGPTGAERGAASATPIGARGESYASNPTGEAGAPNLSTYSRCPDCDGLFSYRIHDEDTGCSYPVDDGEHYCDACDSLWTGDVLEMQAWEPLIEVERLGPGRVAA